MGRAIYGCVSHIEELLDVFLDEFEELPIMEKIIDTETMCDEYQELATPQESYITCDKCESRAVYELLGSEVKAKWE